MKLKKNLFAANFIQKIFEEISKREGKVPLPKNARISLADCVMSCFAMFSLKWPSLLQFDKKRRDPHVAQNLRSLYHVENAPCDTYMRERLDKVPPDLIRPCFKKIFSVLQRDKALEAYQILEGHHLISVDGTGYFSSHKVHCENCCVKNHRNGKTTYYHQMLGAAMVHPDIKQVIPLCPEPIVGQTNTNKNDCEQGATRRLLAHLRREHPHLKIIVVQDALSDCGPNIKQLEELSMKYIIVRKGDPLRWRSQEAIETCEYTDEDRIIHYCRFRNADPLNSSHPEIKTNVFEERYTTKKGKERVGCWITNIHVNKDNIQSLIRGGRARWKIENETFNTLKNQGYGFEHNYGHGKKNLCTVMSFLMLLAFLIDQAQQLRCKLFQQAKEVRGTFLGLWECMRTYFSDFFWKTWEDFLSTIARVKRIDSS